MKYPISKEFRLYAHLTPPISKPFVRLAQKFMRPPAFIHRDPQLTVKLIKIPGHLGAKIDAYVFTPNNRNAPTPCLIDFHGGGFVFEGAAYHYRLAMTYAKESGCTVVFPCYRLAPEYPFPVPTEDAYAAMEWVYDHAQALGVDPENIAVCGDSAGAQLAASVCLLARDRKHPVQLLFQMLIYPFLDNRNDSDSARRYTDTPMWNSRLSAKVQPILNPGMAIRDPRLISPAEVGLVDRLPPAYIETAEFDCLHDDGTLYAAKLRAAGIPVTLNETKGTMHGFDIVLDCPTTKAAVQERIRFLKRHFDRAR